MICRTDICHTADGKLCLIGDPESATMLHGEGAEISDERAQELGVLGNPVYDSGACVKVESKAVESAPENKEIKAPETKSKK